MNAGRRLCGWNRKPPKLIHYFRANKSAVISPFLLFRPCLSSTNHKPRISLLSLEPTTRDHLPLGNNLTKLRTKSISRYRLPCQHEPHLHQCKARQSYRQRGTRQWGLSLVLQQDLLQEQQVKEDPRTEIEVVEVVGECLRTRVGRRNMGRGIRIRGLNSARPISNYPYRRPHDLRIHEEICTQVRKHPRRTVIICFSGDGMMKDMDLLASNTNFFFLTLPPTLNSHMYLWCSWEE